MFINRNAGTDSCSPVPAFLSVTFRVIAQRLAGIARRRFGNVFAHGSVGFYILHPVIVHDTQIAVAECFGHGLGYFRFCLDNFGTGFLAFAFIPALWLRPWRGVPLPWLEQCSCRHWLGLSAGRHRYSYLCQYQQCQWTEFRMLFLHPTPCAIPVLDDRIWILQYRFMIL